MYRHVYTMYIYVINWFIHVYTMYIHVYSRYIHATNMYLYLTISAKYVLILSTKAVDHVNNMGNRRMMEPQPAFLSPLVRLSQSGTLSQAWHHAQHTPGTSLACHYRVKIANSDVNRPDRYLMLNETSINVQNNCQGNSPVTNSANKVLK